MVPSVSRVDEGTAPHTLAEAGRICRQQKRSTDASKYASPVDVVAVVVETSFSRGLVQPTISIWIDDGSLSSKTKAFVSIRGFQNVNLIREQDVSVGDILRFNRISLQAVQTSSEDADDATVVYQFHHARENPEAGNLWFRLCHVDSRSDSLVGEAYADNVPEDMATDPVCLDRLIAWYRQSHYFAARQAPSLKSPPCIRRSLAEFQSSVGLLGNVVARIVDVQQAAPTIAVGRKRRRVSVSSHSFAMLTDRNATLPFIDDSNRFQKILQDALMSRRALRFTRVVSKRMQDLAWMKSGDDIVLVPTQSTIVTPCSDDDEPELSQRPEGSTQRSLLSPTQRILHSQGDRQSFRKCVIEASVQDILLSKNKVSLRRILTSSCSPESVISLLLTTTSNNSSLFSDALVLLDPRSSQLESLRIQISDDILQTLCGGLQANDLLENPTHAYRLLKSLVMDKIVLRWTVEPCRAEDASNYQAISVCLDAL